MGGQGKLQGLAAIITIVVGLIAIWQFVLPMFGLGPVQTASPRPNGGGPQGTIPGFSFVAPTIPGDDAPPAPTGLQLSGNCDDGFVLTWDPVPGATRYRIELDGNFAGSETQPRHDFPSFPDNKEHRYTVIVDAFPGQDSPPSAPVTTPPCSF